MDKTNEVLKLQPCRVKEFGQKVNKHHIDQPVKHAHIIVNFNVSEIRFNTFQTLLIAAILNYQYNIVNSIHLQYHILHYVS